MRILLHDYPGHSFPLELARELACRNNDVLCLYAGYNMTPRGDLEKRSSDPDNFSIEPIFISRPLEKYSFIKRWNQEREYGDVLAKRIEVYRPDVVISSQTPLDAQNRALISSEKVEARFIFWLQDIIGIATHRLLRKKIPVLGHFVGSYYIKLEQKLLRRSDHIVAISDDFKNFLTHEWRCNSDRITVIPNWAPLEKISPQPKNNSWAIEKQLADKFNFIYTGTLGLKHNPALILQLAEHYKEQRSIRVVVVSEGPGADWLRKKAQERSLDNLVLLGYQPLEQLQFVLGAADVLIAVLEKDAGVFSVPSKVLSYLCAQRPLLLAVPSTNLAARIVSQNVAGIVVQPDYTDEFIQAADYLLENPIGRYEFGCNGRLYAEANFDIQRIAARFHAIIQDKFVNSLDLGINLINHPGKQNSKPASLT